MTELKGPGAWVEGEGEKHPREHLRRRFGAEGLILWECDGCQRVGPWGASWHRLGQQEAYDLLGPDGIAVSCGAPACDLKVRAFYLETNELRQKAVARAKEQQQARQRRLLDQDTEYELRRYVQRKRGVG